jgi:hypothetical protein
VGAALGRRDDVDKRAQDGVVTRAPPQRHIDTELALHLGGRHVAALVEDRDGLLEVTVALQPEDVADGLVGGEERAELADAAVEAKRLVTVATRPPVAHHERQPRHEERRLAGPVVELVNRQLGLGQEDLAVGPVPHPGAGRLLGDLADHPRA